MVKTPKNLHEQIMAIIGNPDVIYLPQREVSMTHPRGREPLSFEDQIRLGYALETLENYTDSPNNYS